MSTFTLDQLGSPVVKDDRGQTLHIGEMVPGYGGWGNLGPTKYVTVNGRKAEFVDHVGRNTLRFLRLKWAE